MKTCFTFSFALLLVCTGATLAQTPDWMTPSQETVCDNESGAANGLCNAYCEAMDCELANDSFPDTEPKASATACSKVRSKFQQTTGRDLPCEVQCPCNDPAVSQIFAGIVAGEIPLDVCFTGQVFLVSDGVAVGTNDQPLAIAGFLSGDVYGCAAPDGAAVPLTPEQAGFCRALLEQAAANQGVTCVPAS